VRGLYKKKQSEEYIQRMIEATLQMPTSSAVAVFLGSLMSDNRSALPKIDRPTLIVVARVPAWMSLYENLRNGIRNSRLEVFEDAGHALFVDEAQKFNAILEDFLKTLVVNVI
jgi:non-heme chloroperoxidase